jgi:hypothetical protein
MNKFKEFDLDTIQIVKTDKSPSGHPRRPETIEREKKLYQLLQNLEEGYEFILPDLFNPYLRDLIKLFPDRIYKVSLLRKRKNSSKEVICKRIK